MLLVVSVNYWRTPATSEDPALISRQNAAVFQDKWKAKRESDLGTHNFIRKQGQLHHESKHSANRNQTNSAVATHSINDSRQQHQQRLKKQQQRQQFPVKPEPPQSSTARPSDGHPVAGLSCQAHGGPNDKMGSRSESQVVQDMVYWSDWPTDAMWYSPHAPAASNHSNHQKKYLTFEPDEGGFNNIRMAFETAVVLAIGTGRTLVLPPEMNFYLLGSPVSQKPNAKSTRKNTFGFADFFDLPAIVQEHAPNKNASRPSALKIITFDEFLQHQGGYLVDRRTGQPAFPPHNITHWNGKLPANHATFYQAQHKAGSTLSLWNWMRQVTHSPEDWDLNRCVVAIPGQPGSAALQTLQQTKQAVMQDDHRRAAHFSTKQLQTNPQVVWRDRWRSFLNHPTAVNASAKDRLAELLAHRPTLCLYNETLQTASVLHLQGENAAHRILVHFYAYVFFQDWQQDLWMKRFVRDHLRYHDDIQCAAARIVHALREKARRINPRLASTTNHTSSTNGSVDNQKEEDDDDSFHTMHIRRGDFQFKLLRDMTAQEIYQDNVRNWFTPGKLVYIATDEKNKTFFDPLREHYQLVFLDDFMELLSGVDSHYYGMIEQVVASMGDVFVGAVFSTFSGYIHRMRGYHSQKHQWPGYETGIVRNSYYYAPNGALAAKRQAMHRYQAVEPAFWQREFPVAWRDLDHSFTASRTVQES